jgi:hypothetical protein
MQSAHKNLLSLRVDAPGHGTCHALKGSAVSGHGRFEPTPLDSWQGRSQFATQFAFQHGEIMIAT